MNRIGFFTFLFLCIAAPHPGIAENKETATSGKEIFTGRCGVCHELPNPQSLSRIQWKFVLIKMQKRMEFLGLPPLNESETRKVYQYLSSQIDS